MNEDPILAAIEARLGALRAAYVADFPDISIKGVVGAINEFVERIARRGGRNDPEWLQQIAHLSEEGLEGLIPILNDTLDEAIVASAENSENREHTVDVVKTTSMRSGDGRPATSSHDEVAWEPAADDGAPAVQWGMADDAAGRGPLPASTPRMTGAQGEAYARRRAIENSPNGKGGAWLG